MARVEKTRLADKLSRFHDLWNPRVVAELNGQMVKVAKVQGQHVWHRHADEDELFLVLSGRLRIELRDGHVDLEPGELAVVPRGVEHRPVTLDDDAPTEILLFEPAATRSTGDVDCDLTVEPEDLERL